MKTRIAVLLLMLAGIFLSACESTQFLEELNGVIGTENTLSNERVVAGLKQDLEKGAELASSRASAENGFYGNALLKIPFPEEAIKVKNTALDLGLNSQVENFERTMNRAAEQAAGKAVPIFMDAIRGMSIQDGFKILNGSDNEATQYLRSKTGEKLYQEFFPVVQNAIEAVNLTSLWEPLATAYNTASIFTGSNAVDPDLNAYVTNKAIDGLFVHVAAEEKRIRENPEARVTDLLKEVFGSLDK
ncbi:MAG: DUF4197 domain-containing protein [Leptospiraceae bacterium]|nr:DUF4197 domain-containing protein [Leptospiraceae bacterium]